MNAYIYLTSNHLMNFIIILFFFLLLHLWHMGIPGPGVTLELQLGTPPQPQRHWIRVISATYAAAYSKARSLTQ